MVGRFVVPDTHSLQFVSIFRHESSFTRVRGLGFQQQISSTLEEVRSAHYLRAPSSKAIKWELTKCSNGGFLLCSYGTRKQLVSILLDRFLCTRKGCEGASKSALARSRTGRACEHSASSIVALWD